MIDLDILKERTIDFKLDGELIKVKEPTAKMVKKILSIENVKEDEKVYDETYKVVAEILNNNTSNKKFTADKLLNYPQSVTMKILEELLKSIGSTEENPN